MIEGVGLSLYIYKKILELNGGKVCFASKGKSKVHIFLFPSNFKQIVTLRENTVRPQFFFQTSLILKKIKILLSKFIIH
ncbi:hypothetical protein LCGC14_1521780 [marine sediment metagenome]|uniref:Histidine kinase/HSP90-like ATPase domain-containing protein n=1 Tax=marine sediment metagenome TaxID=412755 RepID=A0A0F9IYF3_9ZZZZ